MHDNSPEAPVPGHPNGVNVTVNVNTNPAPAPAPPPALRLLGYAAIGLLVIGFIVRQLVVGGMITFTLP